MFCFSFSIGIFDSIMTFSKAMSTEWQSTEAPQKSRNDDSKIHQTLKPSQPVDWWNTWHVLLVTDALSEQPVPDLPGEHRGILLLVLADGVDHFRRCHFGLWASYDSWLDWACFVKPARISDWIATTIGVLLQKHVCRNNKNIVIIYIYIYIL